ncbi:MmgE/PrpD family protein [Paraburkholderia sp. J76]|uniref:MmgE/PrpD family protein n=1 Tax=Paraburkholderia sp. J76 TaxID=2805439 RepID=UPI002ABD5C77|nr:MmgE/PrpD family protein [Paraburkholderia sp. J76]
MQERAVSAPDSNSRANSRAPADLTLPQTEASRLARFALTADLDAMPREVVELAREHLLDVIGIALASTRFDFGDAVLAAARALGDGQQAHALGSGAALPAPSAALVNGVLAHGLDFDDTHIGAIYHASAQAMAAAFAAGQAHGASGREVLAAFIVALEVGCRLARVGAGTLHDRAFHPTALCGTFAAAAAAGRLARLDESALTSALGLCGSMAAGILVGEKSWLKRMHPGWAAHSGMVAVELGRAGFKGPATVFEAARGFYSAHIDRVPSGDAMPTHRLGEEWHTLGIALKPYPCCHFIHAFVDAALELRGQFSADEVERIECPLTPALHKIVAEPRERCIRPADPYAALFSVQYVVAVALARGRVDLSTFHDEPLDAPDVLALAEKTWCVPDTASDFPRHFPGEVNVILKDGRRLSVRKTTSLGTPERPLPRQALEEKFIANASRAVSRERALQIIAQVYALDRAPSLGALMELCRA